MSNDFYWHIDNAIDNLKYFFDMIDVSDYFFEFFQNDCFLNYSFDFFNGLIFISKFNYFFILFDDFLDLFHDDWNFNYFLHDCLDVVVHLYELRDNFFDLHNARNLH